MNRVDITELHYITAIASLPRSCGMEFRRRRVLEFRLIDISKNCETVR